MQSFSLHTYTKCYQVVYWDWNISLQSDLQCSLTARIIGSILSSDTKNMFINTYGLFDVQKMKNKKGILEKRET